MTSKDFKLSELSEGVQRKSLGADLPRLLAKWGRTGLLEGLRGATRNNMAKLLENQAAELLKESAGLSTGGANLTSSGQVAGFSNVAFPIVRRVFAGLIANELVSVQPMSLPSGLIFYLDYTYGSNVGGDAGLALSNSATNRTYSRRDSVYNNPAGAGVRSGSLATGGQYDLVGTDYSKVHKQALNLSASSDAIGSWLSGSTWTAGRTVAGPVDLVGINARMIGYDPQVDTDVSTEALDLVFLHMSASSITTNIVGADLASLQSVALTGFNTVGGATAWGERYQGGTGVLNLRKLNKRGNWNGSVFTPDAINGSHVQFVLRLTNAGAAPTLSVAVPAAITGSAAISDSLSVNNDGSTLTIPSFESDFGTSPSPTIPEVDLKIESVAVTATTRKLRARWSPEMAQDLTAFYSIDVEVELTNILSEMITLDIDREILNDLLSQASGANMYWSRATGKFVNKLTGAEVLQASSLSPGPTFQGTSREWTEQLVETIIDVANNIYKKTLRGAANLIVTSTDVCTILEASVAYRASYKLDSDGQVKDGMTLGAESAGSLSNRFTVHKDPYFPSNKILVARKGNTFLDSGYVYAPYVPLLLTPTIYAPEDFTPRRGIMTRYGRKMVRSDFFGTVTVLDMNTI